MGMLLSDPGTGGQRTHWVIAHHSCSCLKQPAAVECSSIPHWWQSVLTFQWNEEQPILLSTGDDVQRQPLSHLVSPINPQ